MPMFESDSQLAVNAHRDLAALRTSALPALALAACDAGSDPVAIDHARRRVQTMAIACAQRVGALLAIGDDLVLRAQFDRVIADAIAIGAFARDPELLAHVRLR